MVAVRADKGGSTFVMGKKNYEKKLSELGGVCRSQEQSS